MSKSEVDMVAHKWEVEIIRDSITRILHTPVPPINRGKQPSLPSKTDWLAKNCHSNNSWTPDRESFLKVKVIMDLEKMLLNK